MIDNEVTGKKLISNGKLKRRYTFIPLNKIASRTLSNDVVKRAESLVSVECRLKIRLFLFHNQSSIAITPFI